MHPKLLQEIGLSEGEAQIYEYLLQNGEAPAGEIIKGVGLKRGNVYNILKSLASRGFAEQFTKNKVAYFRLHHPLKLKEQLEQEVTELEQTKKALQDALPHLVSQFNLSASKPTIHYFEGIEGVKQIYNDTLQNNQSQKVLVFSADATLSHKDLTEEFFQEYIRKRAARDIRTKLISSREITDDVQKFDQEMLRERKRWASFKIPSEIDLYEDKVAIISFEGPLMGLIIENKAIAKTFKGIFNQVWNSLE